MTKIISIFTESLLLTTLVIIFVLKNLLHLFVRVVWEFKRPTWNDLKKANEYYSIKRNGNHVFYDTIFHFVYDINPKKKPLYPKVSYCKWKA